MIKIKKAEPYRLCNSCNSNKNVNSINFYNTSMGNEVCLCENCSRKLIEKLQVFHIATSLMLENESDVSNAIAVYEDMTPEQKDAFTILISLARQEEHKMTANQMIQCIKEIAEREELVQTV